MEPQEREMLRSLAAEYVERASSPENEERRRAWYAHDAGADGRPMLLAELGGLPDSELPSDIVDMQCRDPEAREIERFLRKAIYEHDVLADDHVIEPFFPVNWHVEQSNYGVEVDYHVPAGDGHQTAKNWDPPIKDLDVDLAKLTTRTFTVDTTRTRERIDFLTDLFSGVLEVKLRGGFYWTLGLTQTAIDLIGLEGLMYNMYDNPKGVHDLMAYLRDDVLSFTSWLEANGLYTLNNLNDYVGSGSMGYTKDLPRGEGSVTRRDLWCLSESQETVGVSPEMFGEFVFPYQKEVTDHFGKVYYGCCEPVNNRIDIIKRMENLARVSVSPWADEEAMADACGTELVYSRKPNPTPISGDVFEEEQLRASLEHTARVAAGCRLEVIMKDVHTLGNEPDRLARWVALARSIFN